MRRMPWLMTVVGTVWGLGCGNLGIGPNELVSDSLTVLAKASPSEVASGDSLQIVAVYHNRLDRPLSIYFGMGCPFFLEVRDRRFGNRVPFDGSQYGCTLMGTSLTIPAGESTTSSMWLRASVGGQPVPQGRYVARLDFTNSMRDLEADILVR